MSTSLSPGHPKQQLLFYVAQDIDDELRGKLRAFVIGLSELVPWVNGPPHLVESVEDARGTSGDDSPIETLGAYIEIYSALPPLKLPASIDLQHLNEVTALIRAVQDFSKKNGVSIEFELDGTFVGSIEDGRMNRSLAEGLLGEWRRNLLRG